MNALKPKVTIMIPTYNQEQYIAEAIEISKHLIFSNHKHTSH